MEMLNIRAMKLHYILYLLSFALASCSGKLVNVSPVTGFDSERYLGTWYEIARLDHTFERGLTDVSATSSRSYNIKPKIMT